MPPVSEVEPKPGRVQDGSGQLTRADCLCPICLEIFLEPVTLPCEHTFCKPCFLETVDKANMCCPLCRKRVSTWARLNGRNKTLVNEELWKRIQSAFPIQCQRRLNGVEEEVEEEEEIDMLIPKRQVSEPGELRQEYEDQVSKLMAEKQAMEEAERRASEEYIQRLLAEEEQRIAEERRREENRQLEEDEQLARLLSEELNSTPVLESHTNIKPASDKKKKPSVGHIEKFLCPVPFRQPSEETSPTSTLSSNKENILSSPTTLWPCPMDPTPSHEMPVVDYYGTPSTSNSGLDSSEQLPANRTNISSKRKTLDTDLAAEEAYFNKRPCGSAQPEPISPKEDILQELALQEEILRSRWQQEEEDRRLAQRLQRELNRARSVDRRKGSADSYLLREKSSPPSTSTSPGEEKSNTSDSLGTNAGSSGKKSSRAGAHQGGKGTKKSPVCKQSSPSTPSGSVLRDAKQTTLTEMFPNMGS